MLNESLALGFGMAHYTLVKNLDGITPEEALKPPEAGGNCINWVAGHILACRDIISKQLGGEAFLGEEEGRPYQRGSAPLGSGAPCVDLPGLLEGLEKTAAVLADTMMSLGQEALAGPLDLSAFPLPVEKPTLGAWLTLFMFHESYHAGQVGILRRLAGKEAVLK